MSNEKLTKPSQKPHVQYAPPPQTSPSTLLPPGLLLPLESASVRPPENSKPLFPTSASLPVNKLAGAIIAGAILQKSGLDYFYNAQGELHEQRIARIKSLVEAL